MINKSKDENLKYKNKLTSKEYRITRKGETETPFTGKYCNFFDVKVFLDEVYIGWGIESYLPKLKRHSNLIISSSFSKIAFASTRVGWLVASKELREKIETTRPIYEIDYFASKFIEFIVEHQDYVDDLKKSILDTKNRWYNKLSKSKKFKVYNSQSYVLRLYSEDKELVKKTYNNLYDKKIVVGLVDDKNLVFSVSKNKDIENIILSEVVSENISSNKK